MWYYNQIGIPVMTILLFRCGGDDISNVCSFRHYYYSYRFPRHFQIGSVRQSWLFLTDLFILFINYSHTYSLCYLKLRLWLWRSWALALYTINGIPIRVHNMCVARVFSSAIRRSWVVTSLGVLYKVFRDNALSRHSIIFTHYIHFNSTL